MGTEKIEIGTRILFTFLNNECLQVGRDTSGTGTTPLSLHTSTELVPQTKLLIPTSAIATGGTKA